MSLLPPGRFLMPGDLAGSPALTFAPLEAAGDGEAPAGSLWAMMQRRYEAYKDVVVRPFFRDHFARLDRQIVLVDALAALNAGPDAVQRPRRPRSPRSSTRSAPGAPRWSARCSARASTASCSPPPRPITCITLNHDRLEAILARMTERAIGRGEVLRRRGRRGGARRGARDARGDGARAGVKNFPSIIGTPLAGERAGARLSTATRKSPTFPGDLPDDPAALFARRAASGA